MKRYLLYILFFIASLLVTKLAEAQSISVSGGWSLNIPATNIIEAGDDFTNPFTSSGTNITIDLNVFQNKKFDVYVNKSDVDWDNGLTLTVTRTSQGSPPGNINGGQNPVSIGNNQVTFFSGKGDKTDIQILYTLSGVSVTMPAKTYITTVVYTLVQN